MENNRGNLTEKAVSYIKKNIQNGEWQVGEKIPSENELCSILGISRVTVRSALQQFIALDILESVHGKGTYLKSANVMAFGTGKTIEGTEDTINELKYMLEMRSMLEPDVCARVAPKASPELISELSHYLDCMLKSKDDNGSFSEYDIKFHLAICRETHNPILIGVMSDLFTKKREMYNILNLTIGYYGGIYYHSLLVDAFKRHDGRLARDCMREHLERGIIDVTMDNQPENEAAE